MRKAVTVAMSVITFFFLSIGVMGYLAFGNPPCGEGGNILTCFDNPRWLLIATNFMVLIHIFPAYQVGAASRFVVGSAAVWRCAPQAAASAATGEGGFAGWLAGWLSW
jgi:amino acid permease